jgi:hypothetical protein
VFAGKFAPLVACAAALLGTVLDGRTARAQAGPASDPAALFDKGLADMRAHRFPEACRELAESYRIEPHAGGLFTLAECDTQSGKVASALADYDSFLDLVAHLPARERGKQDERARIAAERRVALAREVPSVTISLDAAVPAGSTVSVDGRAIPTARLGSLLPLDPGDHLVTVQAPDGRTGEQHVSLAPRDARAVTLALSIRAPDKAAPSASKDDDPGATWRTAAFATGGVGAAALIAGTVMGAIVAGKKSSIDSNCPTASTCASLADASAANSAKTLGWASTGAFIGGGALAGVAAVLWFARPTRSAVEPVVTPLGRGGVIGLGGVF